MYNISAIKPDLRKQTLKIYFSHPSAPSEELCLLLEDAGNRFDLNVLIDYLDATGFPVKTMSAEEGKILCRGLYAKAVKKIMQKQAEAALEKAKNTRHSYVI